jgi:hypothetical protein
MRGSRCGNGTAIQGLAAAAPTQGSSGTVNVVTGQQLTGMFTGIPSSGLNLNTGTGPNALLKSASYPVPSSSSPGPLTQVPLPGGGPGYWYVDNGSSGYFTMPALWSAGPSTPYVYNNLASNLGGIVPAGGLMIDGYPVAAGVYVFQFMDFSLGNTLYCVNGPPILLRGCRWRPASSGAPGLFNVQSTYNANSVCAHYCDVGAPSATATAQTGIDLNYGTNIRVLRCYLSYLSTMIQPNGDGYADVIENFMEKLTLFNASYHLNGITMNGANLNALILRNSAVFAAADEAGNQIQQTDCVSFFQDFGNFPGTGLNSDGSTGYFVKGNYAGGSGYCYYFGQDNENGTVGNMNASGNLVTTSVYSSGGFFGPVTAQPPWGSAGNAKSGNVWADGPSAGMTFM